MSLFMTLVMKRSIDIDINSNVMNTALPYDNSKLEVQLLFFFVNFYNHGPTKLVICYLLQS